MDLTCLIGDNFTVPDFEKCKEEKEVIFLYFTHLILTFSIFSLPDRKGCLDMGHRFCLCSASSNKEQKTATNQNCLNFNSLENVPLLRWAPLWEVWENVCSSSTSGHIKAFSSSLLSWRCGVILKPENMNLLKLRFFTHLAWPSFASLSYRTSTPWRGSLLPLPLD